MSVWLTHVRLDLTRRVRLARQAAKSLSCGYPMTPNRRQRVYDFFSPNTMPEVFAQAYDLEEITPYNAADAFSNALQQWTRPRWPKAMPWFALDESRALQATDGSIFRWEQFADGTRRLIEFTWRHPHQTSPTIHWSTRVAFAVLPHRIHLSIRVSNTGPALGHPDVLLTTRPRLLLTLLEHFALRTRGMSLQVSPIALAEDDFAAFVRYELFDPTRRYPIAFLSPTPTDEYVLSPAAFGREFVGLAKTYRAASAGSTFALTSELGRRELSCFHGAMRIYMPGFGRNSDPRQHPLVLPRRLATGTDRLRIAQALTALTPRHFEEEPFIAQLRDERAVVLDERRSVLIAQLSQAQKAATDGDDYRQLAEVYASQNAELEQENERLREDLEEARYKTAALQYALEQRVEPTGASLPPLFTPVDVADAVEQAQNLFPDELLILPSALKSAEESPYRSPEEVADALAAIAEVARRLKGGQLGKRVRDAFAELQLDYSGGLAETTPKKMRKQYVFSDGEREYVCEEHIRIGGGSYDPADSLRIYLNTKAKPHGRVVIGHVGRHLEVISTT